MNRADAVDFDDLARRAADGDQRALSELLRGLQDPMYRLALRFLGHPHDAQDACQEILVRIMTHLSSFEGRSKLTTWAYRCYLDGCSPIGDRRPRGEILVRPSPGRQLDLIAWTFDCLVVDSGPSPLPDACSKFRIVFK